MTKNELIKLDFELTDPEDYAGVWSNKELENAMVAAYNKGIEDARCVAECGYLKEIGSLKIK